MLVATIATVLSTTLSVSAAPAANSSAIEKRNYGYVQPEHYSCAHGWSWHDSGCCRDDCWWNNQCNPHPQCGAGWSWRGDSCCRNDCWYNDVCNPHPRCADGHSWYGDSCCRDDCWYNDVCNPHPRGYVAPHGHYGKNKQ